MINLRVRPVGAKHIRISGIEPFLADCLQGLGEVLEQGDSPKARERLFPNPTIADDKANAEWQRLIHLRCAIFSSRRVKPSLET